MYNIVEERTASYKNVQDMIFALAARYSFLKINIIGQTELLKNIYSISLGKSDKKILYMAAFHGKEWLTSLIVLKFIEDLCESYRMNRKLSDINVSDILSEAALIFVPLVNPDGVDIGLFGKSACGKNAKKIMEITDGDFSSWNANANGVDINHNFDAGFELLKIIERNAGIVSPAPGRYGGEYAESENETRAIADLCRNVNLKHALCFHSQGEEIFFKYGNNTPEKSLLMAQIMSSSSGYDLVKQEGLASHGGCKDFIIDKLKRPAFTIEIGKGKNPLPLSDFSKIYEQISEMLVISAIL